MSKWKDKPVKIVQIINYENFVYGLGDDGLMYQWHQLKGKWLKYWIQEDDE